MASTLLAVTSLCIFLIPGKYLGIGGAGILFSLQAALFLISFGSDVFKAWQFWMILVLAIVCDGYWLSRYFKNR